MKIGKYSTHHSHCILAKFAISEPQDKRKPGWADMTVEQTYEVLSRGSQQAFRFLRELLLTNNGDFVYNCYVKALEECARYLDAATQRYLRDHGLVYEQFENVPPKGSLMLQARIMIPRHRQARVPTEVLLFVNNETKSAPSEEYAIQATGPQMAIQLAHAIMLLVKEARGEVNKDTAMPPAKDGKIIS